MKEKKFIYLYIMLYIIRFFSSIYSTSFLYDCDEVYNYWEPIHYLTYGFGFQTWEYSPMYGIRSYAYLKPFEIITNFFKWFIEDKVI